MNADEFAHHVQRAKKRSGWYTGLCPAHNDRNPSLSWKDSTTGREGVSVKCFTGCSREEILSALNLKEEDISGGIRVQRPFRKGSRNQSKKGYRHRQRDLLEKAIKKGNTL